MKPDSDKLKELEKIKERILSGEKVQGYRIAESGPFKGMVIKDKGKTFNKARHWI